MNKLYLLVALGLSVKADVTSSVTGVSTTSNGWYAGDCLDDSTFSGTYGSVDFNCGDNCMTDYTNGSGASGSYYYCSNYSNYYSACVTYVEGCNTI
jgi:hypothetical protein